MDDLITMSEAAILRGVTVGAINHLVNRGRLRGVERYGKTLVSRSEVVGFKAAKGGRGKRAGV